MSTHTHENEIEISADEMSRAYMQRVSELEQSLIFEKIKNDKLFQKIRSLEASAELEQKKEEG